MDGEGKFRGYRKVEGIREERKQVRKGEEEVQEMTGKYIDG